jgi:SAM-dependent methyltransferase
VNAREAATIGDRTLRAFAETPRLNAWIYAKLAGGVRGDVLEVGSGIGTFSRLIARDAERAVLSDVDPERVAALRREFAGDPRVEAVRYDLDGPPPESVAARRFDAIVAVNVIEHITDDRQVVANLAGLLKPGGRLLVYVPACPFAFGSLDDALVHRRRYTPGGLAALLASAGLDCQPPRYMNLLGLLGWVVSGRLLRRRQLSPALVALFEQVVPLVRLEDRVRLPLGLGLHAQATKLGPAVPGGAP